MISLNVISKLISRTTVPIGSRSLATSGVLWKQRGDCPDPYSQSQSSQGQRKGSDDCPEEGVKKQQKTSSCCAQGGAENPERKEVKIQLKSRANRLDKEDCHSDTKKHERKKMCNPVLPSERPPKEKDKCLQEEKQPKSKDCQCPPFDTPKCVGDKSIKKQHKSESECSEEETPKCPAEEDVCADKRKQNREDPCEGKISSRKPLCPEEKDECGNIIKEEGNYPCGPMEPCHKNICSQEEDKCLKGSYPKKNYPCGTMKYSDKNICPKENDECANKKSFVDPCKSIKSARKQCCPEERECANESKKMFIDPCDSMKSARKNDCPEERDECAKSCVQIPEVSPHCSVESAKECVEKLKELQRQWEEVIAAQRGEGKENCPDKGQLKPKKKHSLEQIMIFVVLGAILAGVAYYIYTEPIEPEETDGNDDDDDE